MPTKHAPLFASHRAAPEWSTDLTSARGWQAPVGAAPGSLAGVTFLHLGKAGGQSLQFGLKKLAGRGAFNTLVQVHDARDRWNYSMTGGKGRYVSMRGPLHVGEPSPRRARAEALIADYPVVLWVRDPVSRFVSCWEAWLNSGNATVTATRRQRWSANLLRATGRSVQAGDLDGALLALRSSKNFTLTRRVLATIEHADLDLAWYVGNVAGIGDVERRLGLVGALERCVQPSPAAPSPAPLLARPGLTRHETHHRMHVWHAC